MLAARSSFQPKMPEGGREGGREQEGNAAFVFQFWFFSCVRACACVCVGVGLEWEFSVNTSVNLPI